MIDYTKYFVDSDGDTFIVVGGLRVHTVVYYNLYLHKDNNVVDYFGFVFNIEMQEKAHNMVYIGI